MSALTIETCPDHTRCMSCDTEVCEACQVGGGATRCPHGDPICSDCDPTDWCGDCYAEQRDAAAARRDGYEPLTGGIMAALPSIDEFVAGHSFDSYAKIARLIADA